MDLNINTISSQSRFHRIILESARKLPPSPQIGDEGFPVPETLHDWLEKINLLDYELKFRRSGYDNMDRIRVMWELELSTVSLIILTAISKLKLAALKFFSLHKASIVAPQKILKSNSEILYLFKKKLQNVSQCKKICFTSWTWLQW